MPKASALKVVTVGTLTQFARQVELLLGRSSARGNWYRGVGRGSYTLSPGLYRHKSVTTIEGLLKLESKMLEDFSRFSVLHTTETDTAGSDGPFRMLFFMQHYGIPTRLLDWSSNPFIALYFALSTAHYKPGEIIPSEPAAVWVLDPTAWNRKALAGHGDAGPLSHNDAVDAYGPRRLFGGKFEPTAFTTLGEGAACLLGVTNNVRMFAQRGVFTIFGKDLDPIDKQYLNGTHERGTLTKIEVPPDKVTTLLTHLLRLGYTDSVSYPDLQGLAMEIKRSNGFGA